MPRKKITTEQFVTRAREIHGDRYDYTPSVYVKRHSKITILCSVHGEFEQSPNNHLRGSGCPTCKFDKLSKIHSNTTEQFIEKAIKIHGDRYRYSLTKYTNRHTKLTITCHHHGDFIQNANDHLNGKGCPSCAAEARGYVSPNDLTPAHLYIIKLTDGESGESFIKVGITSTSPRIRINNISKYKSSIIVDKEIPLGRAYETEQQILSKYNHLKYEPIKHFGGHTECFCVEALDQLKTECDQL